MTRGERGGLFPFLYRPLPNKNFVDTYDTLIANSTFTQGWIRRWWERAWGRMRTFPSRRCYSDR